MAYERGYVGDVTGEYNGVNTGQDLGDSRTATQLIDDAVRAARDADMVIFVGGLNKSDNQDAEGSDRLDFSFPYNQDAVIEALADANPNIAVVNLTGNAYAMPWKEKVAAIIQGWYIGSETGNALADVIFGDVIYKEGIDVGYRHTDRLKPSRVNYAFGHGLSYTTFKLGKASATDKVFDGKGVFTIQVPVTNTGEMAGAEVVQGIRA